MIKVSNKIIIDAIKSEIEKCTERSKVVAKFCKKFQKSARTVDTYWKIAQEQHTAKQQAIKEKLAAIDTQAAIDARKKAIMTADERKELLTSIANGTLKIKKPFVIGGKIMEYPAEPDHTDRKNAIAELNKMGGDYSPTKIEATGANGQPLIPTTLTVEIVPPKQEV